MAIPQSLQDRLRHGQVVPFVGAGVSMSVRDRISQQPAFPSWRQLLNAAADRLDKENKKADADLVRSLLNVNPPDFLEAASRARKGLGGVWYEFLKEQIDVDFERIDLASLEHARRIWRLGSKLVITTNYDEVLRWACPHPNLQSWDIVAPVEQAFLLRGELKRPVIWHLHGHITNASELILSRDAYHLLYPETNPGERKGHYEAALTTLQHQLAAKSLLFIGFSLDDEHIGLQLKNVHELYSGAGTHYALVREGEAERVRNLNVGVEPITFSHFDGPLLALLKELEDVVESQKPVSVGQNKPNDRPLVIPDYGPHRSVFYVPFKQKGDEIVGQQQVLQDVRKQLTAGKRTAIGQTAAFRGLGGLGKTQLAIEYAYRYRDEYPNGVIWINADQDIDAQLIDIAEKARWIAPESDHKYKIQIAQQRIRSYSECLIVFDNLDDRAAIEAYLPEPEANPHILVTSRVDHVDFYPVPVPLLNEKLSLELLIREARRQPQSDKEERAAESIVVLLGGLPLALELAGAYLSHRRTVTFRQYYELLSKDLKSALPKSVSSFTKHEADLYRTLRLSEGLLEEERYLRDILDLLTWSGSAPMSTDLISHLLDLSDGSLAGSLALGAELRLLQRNHSADTYALHRLVGEVRRGEVILEQRLDWVDAMCNRLGDWFHGKKRDFLQLTRFESEIDHLKKWQENAAEFAPLHSSRLMWLQAYPAYHRAQYAEARNYVVEAQRIFDQLQDTNRELQANLLNDLYVINTETGHGPIDPSEALSIRRELFGELHPDIADSLDNLGNWYQNQGDLQRALECRLEALDMRRALFGERHPDIATSLNNVGDVYGSQGDPQRGLEYCRTALEMLRGLLGDRHPNVARSLNNIGMFYRQLGDRQAALEHSQQALIMRIELLGEQHPSTIYGATRVVTDLMRLNQREEAYALVAHFLTKVSPQDPSIDRLKHLEVQLLSTTIRKGFRQPPKRGGRKTKKKRR